MPGVLLTDVIHSAESRTKDVAFDQARAHETCGLFGKGAFKVTSLEGAGDIPNVLGSRFVRSI